MLKLKPFLLFLSLAVTTLVAAAVVARRITDGTNEVDALAGWLSLAAVAGGTILLFEFVLRAAAVDSRERMRARLLVGTCLALLFAVEATFRYGTPRWATYAERNGGVYVSQFKGEPTWFHTYSPRSLFSFTKTEFTHVRQINALGFTDREFEVEKASGEYRILALGDSFTEGFGTSADTTWVKVTEARLGERYPARRVTSLNAGVSGSDPYFAYMVLKEKLRPYQPDLVILAINTSDVSEIIIRGGSERFQPDGTVSFDTGPGWERLYALSYIWRAVVHEVLDYDFLLVKGRDLAARQREAVRLLRAALETMRDFCRAQRMDLLVVSHPHRWELQRGSYDVPAYDELMRRLEGDADLRFVDLMRSYTEDGRITKETAPDFYWPLDLHHNTAGYRIMGEAIAAQIVDMGL